MFLNRKFRFFSFVKRKTSPEISVKASASDEVMSRLRAVVMGSASGKRWFDAMSVISQSMEKHADTPAKGLKGSCAPQLCASALSRGAKKEGAAGSRMVMREKGCLEAWKRMSTQFQVQGMSCSNHHRMRSFGRTAQRGQHHCRALSTIPEPSIEDQNKFLRAIADMRQPHLWFPQARDMKRR